MGEDVLNDLRLECLKLAQDAEFPFGEGRDSIPDVEDVLKRARDYTAFIENKEELA